MRFIPLTLMMLFMCSYAYSDTEYDKTEKELNSQIGKANYQYFLQLMETPNSVSKDSETFSCQWITEDKVLILTFDKSDEILKKWRLITPQNRPKYNPENSDRKTSGAGDSIRGFLGNALQATAVGAKSFAIGMRESRPEKYVYKDSYGREVGTVERRNY